MHPECDEMVVRRQTRIYNRQLIRAHTRLLTPRTHVRLGSATGGEGQHDLGCFLEGRPQRQSMKTKENENGMKSNPLVTVHEWMIAAQSDRICDSDIHHHFQFAVVETMPGAHQRRFEQSEIA